MLAGILQGLGEKHDDPHMIDAGLRLAATAINRESRSVPMAEPAEPRRLPAPWRVVEHSESFVGEDANGRPLAYVYFENEPVRVAS